jgi:uncharacterized protein (DUF488 family)
MLFSRQKLLLTLLDAVGTPVSHTDFQKLLLFYTHEYEAEPSFDFVPYRFGAFSFTSYADKRKLIAVGALEEDDQSWSLTKKGQNMARQHSVDSLAILAFSEKYATLRGNRLIVEQYTRYPWYATRSELLDRLPLRPETREHIQAARPKPRGPGLTTIGYEGRSLEAYLNILLHNGVTLLCDVRRNPLSRKYGFSKGTLGKACDGIGIRYEHLPELGIASEQRRTLNTQADYDALFANYETSSLPLQKETLQKIHVWVESGERVALTCFERLPEQCHRHCVAEALHALGGKTVALKHL